MQCEKANEALRIVVFDMDGVLVDIKSSWQFIHNAFGADNSENLKKYVEGKMTYEELMRRDIALWGRVHVDRIKDILSTAPMMVGATETFSRLRKAGMRTAVISAGVSVLADRLQAILGLDYVYANRVLTDQNGFLTGEGEETVCLLGKLSVLRKLAAEEHVRLRECAVIGDSIYDVPMFRKAGLSLAFNTDDCDVRKAAKVVIEKKDLRETLPYLTRGLE